MAKIRTKSPEEIETLAAGGKILAAILDELETMALPKATGKQLDDRAQQLCRDHGVTPAFLGYTTKGHSPFPAALCVSNNDAVVHGLPTDTPFAEGDLVGIDMGIIHQGLYLDSARTVAVGAVSKEVQQLLNVTKESLRLGIEAARAGNTTGHIGEAIQSYVETQGRQYGIVSQLVGHGVGYAVHEPPQVPNFGKAGTGDLLKEGLVIAIEPMITLGNPEITTAEDNWTIVTLDGGIAAHQEHTVAVTAKGPRILTTT